MAEPTRPPKPDCDFDFNLPHGVDVEDTPVVDHDDIEDNTEYAQDTLNAQETHTPMEGIQLPESHGGPSNFQNQGSAQQVMDYATLAAGFSDDEGGEEAFDRSWSSRRTKKPPPPLNKSPRRWEDGDGDDEASPTKRARQSLFGGPVEEGEIDEEQEIDFHDESHTSPDPDIDDGMSTLHIDSALQAVEEQSVQIPGTFRARSTSPTSERDSLSPPPSSVLSEDEFEIPPDTQPAYALRQNIDRLKSTTYIDTDKTGNYDPSQEAVKAKNARVQALLKQRDKAARKDKEKAKGKKKGKGKAHEDPIEKCIVVLRFDNFGNVRNLTNEEDNWPSGHSEIESDWEREVEQNREFYRYNTPGVQQIAIDDPSGELDDLTGYPEARGCQQCRRSEKDCGMIHGGKYPCEQCLDEQLECRTILRPEVHGNCERCQEDGEECSFQNKPEQVSCDNCSFEQQACVPIPPHDYRTPRASLDKLLYGPDRKYANCTHCRREKKRCSLKNKTDKPPCNFCKKNGLGCHFEDLPKAIREKKPAEKKNAEGAARVSAPEVSRPDSQFFSAADIADMHNPSRIERVRETTPKIEMEDEAGNKGMLEKIQTSFANPIQFDIFNDHTPDCNFCEMPMFGFVGHFERQVHVISWDNGLGYTEVGGGHTTEKGDPDKMCKSCILMRMQIVCCNNHAFERLPDAAGPLDFDNMANEIISAYPGSTDFLYQQSRWCSLCFTPAVVGCGTRQQSMFGQEEDEVIGCGARLCEGCFEALQRNFDGNFQWLAQTMAQQPKTAEGDEDDGQLQGKPRADVDFLSQEGLLMRNVSAAQEE